MIPAAATRAHYHWSWPEGIKLCHLGMMKKIDLSVKTALIIGTAEGHGWLGQEALGVRDVLRWPGCRTKVAGPRQSASAGVALAHEST